MPGSASRACKPSRSHWSRPVCSHRPALQTNKHFPKVHYHVRQMIHSPCFLMNINNENRHCHSSLHSESRHCHSERSEESRVGPGQILRCAQNDSARAIKTGKVHGG